LICTEVFLWLTHQKTWKFSAQDWNWGGDNWPHCPPGYAPG